MRGMRTSLISLIAFAVIAGPMIALDAEAGVRFDATFRTDNMKVRVGNTHSDYYSIYKRRPMPIRHQRNYGIRKQDHKIAGRIARYTGIPKRDLIQLRRTGYSWLEIGMWIELPRPVVRAAMNRRSWERFLMEERRIAMHMKGRNGRRR